MIDPAIISTALAVAAIGGVGAVVLLSARKAPGEEFSDADRPAIKYGDEMPPRPRYAAMMPGGKIEFVGLDATPAGKRPDTEFAMKRHALMAGALAEDEELPPIPEADRLRFFVPTKKSRDGFWHVRDRANFREVPQIYTTRRSALRGARRLNAKAEIAEVRLAP